MLTLVAVTLDDIDVLFEVVAFSEAPEKETLLAGLVQMSNHFKATNDKTARMVLVPELLNQMRDAVNTFLPADALRHGIPTERADYMFKRLPGITKKLSFPETYAPTPLGPQKVLLN